MDGRCLAQFLSPSTTRLRLHRFVPKVLGKEDSRLTARLLPESAEGFFGGQNRDDRAPDDRFPSVPFVSIPRSNQTADLRETGRAVAGVRHSAALLEQNRPISGRSLGDPEIA